MGRSATEITNLLAQYALCADSANVAGALALLKQATVAVGDRRHPEELSTEGSIEKMLRATFDRSPRSQHLVANPIVRVDEARGVATCYSYHLALAGNVSSGMPVQSLTTGRYNDRFERVKGAWQFRYRDSTLADSPEVTEEQATARIDSSNVSDAGAGATSSAVSDATQIANLLNGYADLKDGGDLIGASALFKHAKIKMSADGELQDNSAQLATLQKIVRPVPGINRARHLITNPIIEIDADRKEATCRSYYAIFRSTQAYALQPVSAGRYHDRFERVDGVWRFSFRDHTLFDMKGVGYEHNPAIPAGHANRGTPHLISRAARQGSEVEILNGVYRYAEHIDNGDFAAAAALLVNAQLKVKGRALQGRDVLAHLRDSIMLYPCGTPRTKHLITNPLVEVNEAGGTARCSSRYTILQATDEFPVQVIGAGRYLDLFERIDGAWQFRSRDFTQCDAQGDCSRHLRT